MAADFYFSLWMASTMPRAGWASRVSVSMEKAEGATRRHLAHIAYLINRHAGVIGNSILSLSCTAKWSFPNSENNPFDFCPLRSKTKGFPKVYRISGRLFCPSVGTMQLGACRKRRRISRSALETERFFKTRKSLNHWGYVSSSLAPDAIQKEMVDLRPSCNVLRSGCSATSRHQPITPFNDCSE